MSNPFLITDGYTKKVGFNACDDFEEFTFEYRPLRGLESSTSSRDLLVDDKEERESAWFAFLNKHVCAWSISKDFVNDIKIAQPLIITLMTNVVFGHSKPDFVVDLNGHKIDPEEDSTDEGDAGNSPAG